jgi:hypothetical protein
MKIELNIPENLEDITLEQYQKFLSIENPSNDDLLSVFLNLNQQGIDKIKASEIDRLVVFINSLFEVKQEHKLKFTLRGQEFGFIPDIDNITYGENKDITTYVNDWQSMHKAMAVLYRPITQTQKGKYLIQEYNGTREYSELMKQMPLSVAMGAMVFFYNLTNELLNYIPSYLEKVTVQEQMKGVISAENGELIQKSIALLKVTLEDLKRLQSYPYISA